MSTEEFNEDVASYEELHKVREQLGDQIVLLDQQQEETFFVVTELALNNKHYCVLKKTMKKDDDEEFMFIVVEQGAELSIVPIEEENEWELVSEAYDNWLFDHGK